MQGGGDVGTSEACEQSPGTCGVIFVVPDTNVWFNKRELLFSVLGEYRDFVTIALPHIMIDEGLPETYKRAVLHRVGEEIAYQQFRQKLLNSILDAITRGFAVTVAHVPGIYGATRIDFMYLSSKEDVEVLDLVVCEYVGKERCYYSTLDQVIKLLSKHVDEAASELRSLEEKISGGSCSYDYFATVLKWCSTSLYEVGDKQLRSNIKRLFGVLADALIIASSIHLAKIRKCKSVVCVSDDSTLLCVLKKVREQLRLTNLHGYKLGCELKHALSQLTQSPR